MSLVPATKTALLELVFPTLCLGCNARGSWFCTTCDTVSHLTSLPEACAFCNRVTRGPGRLCDRDRQRVGLTGLVAYGDYHAAPLARAIAGIKYDGYFAAVPALTQLAADHWSVLGSAGSTTIIPIPLARKRLRERGFNQAELLTRTLSQLLDTPVETALVRSRETTSQVGLGRTERAANVVDAFTWRGNPLHGAVVLVDDVVTTGATLGSAAQTLRAHGAREVWAATLAVER